MRLLLRFPPTRLALTCLADQNILRARIEEALRTELVQQRSGAHEDAHVDAVTRAWSPASRANGDQRTQVERATLAELHGDGR